MNKDFSGHDKRGAQLSQPATHPEFPGRVLMFAALFSIVQSHMQSGPSLLALICSKVVLFFIASFFLNHMT